MWWRILILVALVLGSSTAPSLAQRRASRLARNSSEAELLPMLPAPDGYHEELPEDHLPSDQYRSYHGERHPPLPAEPEYRHDMLWPEEEAWPAPPGLGMAPLAYGNPWSWQLLPEGLLFRSYLASGRESRLGSVWYYERERGWLWDTTLGGRVGILRFGSDDNLRPEGWQLDVEGAAFPRLDIEENRDLDSADFRFGVPLTYARGPWEAKLAYYHFSSHLGDEYIQRNPTAQRINYSRDAMVVALAYRLQDDLRLYAEAGYAFYNSGGSRPWEFQFGVDWSPLWATGFCGAPFLAVNGHLRQEVNFGGNLIAQAGWQWRGRYNGPLLRTGFQYFNGKSLQAQFFNEHEEQFGLGVWYDY